MKKLINTTPERPKFNREAVLKGLLLFALIANVSWQPSNRKAVINQLGLSSEAKSSGPSAAPSADAAPIAPLAPIEQREADPERAGLQNDRVDSIKVCEQRVLITYSEVRDSRGQISTRIVVRPHTGGAQSFKPFAHTIPQGFALNLDRPDVKDDIQSDLEKNIRNRLGTLCAFQASNNARIDVQSPSANDEERARIRRGMGSCLMDARGNALTESTRMSCQLRRLSEVDSKSDRVGGQAHVMAQIEALMPGIRQGIKNRLMSRDENQIQEGLDYLDETKDTLQELGVEHNLDPQRLSRMAMSLESLKAGAETFRRSADFDQDVRATKEELRNQLIDADMLMRTYPGDPMVQMRVQQIRADVRNRSNQLEMEAIRSINPYYTQLLSAQRSGLMPLSEFTQFAQPYQTLSMDLNIISNPQLLMNNGMGPNPPMGQSMGTLGGPYNPAMPGVYRPNTPIAPNMMPFPQTPMAPMGPGVSPLQGRPMNGGPVFVGGPLNSTGSVMNPTAYTGPALFNQNSVRNPNLPPMQPARF
jgi:hypothetical protein